MEGKIKISITSAGRGIAMNKDMNPVQKQLLEDRIVKLCLGLYTVDSDGRCIIGPEDVAKLLSYSRMAVTQNEVLLKPDDRSQLTGVGIEFDLK